VLGSILLWESKAPDPAIDSSRGDALLMLPFRLCFALLQPRRSTAGSRIAFRYIRLIPFTLLGPSFGPLLYCVATFFLPFPLPPPPIP